MKDFWNRLEERTRTRNALQRRHPADAIWVDYAARGDVRLMSNFLEKSIFPLDKCE